MSFVRDNQKLIPSGQESFELASVDEDQFGIRRMDTPLIFDGRIIGTLNMSINLWPIYTRYISVVGVILLIISSLWVFVRTISFRIRFENQINTFEHSEHDFLQNELMQQMKKSGIELVYQPIIRMVDRGVFGFEVKVSWEHSSGETYRLSPAEFVQMAKRQGLVLPIADWIYQLTARNAVKWQKDFGPLIISMNVSADQLMDDQFAITLKQSCLKEGYPYQLLELEISENEILSIDPKKLASQLENLQSEHLSLTIDDFGLHINSLENVNLVQKICLDQRLIKLMLADANVYELMQGLMRIAHRQDIQVRADGVESVEQMAQLKNLGVLFVQGSLVSQPLTQNEVMPYLLQARQQNLSQIRPANLELA